ncbi:hypothetical protein KC316_g510 [Hortaea werneckii]|nr:hypothetical protein KC324_g590 [Hortaea werneckii]KAI7595481.1 hypothetical protein KC316_g510 [Hortaea werneckii]
MRLALHSLFFSASFAVGTAETSCSHVCQILSQGLPGQVVTPEQQIEYNAFNADRWSDTAILPNRCIVFPASAAQVAFTLQVLVGDPTEHAAAVCNFAVTSGGHSPNVGFNDIDGGVSIDLRRINTTAIAQDRSLVSLGSGARWRNVYASLQDTGVIIPGAECSETGVGGVILGGGISYFLPRVGFVADNVINYEVVLASGEIVNANSTSHQDLWLALRGGSSNFGIVTRFDVAALPEGPVWGGGLTQPAQAHTTDEVLRALHHLAGDPDRDRYAAYGVLWSYNTTTGNRRITHTLVHTNGTAHPDAFRPFEDIQPRLSSSLRSTTIASLTEEASAFMPKGFRDFGATVTFKNDLETLREVHRIADEVAQKVSYVQNMTWIFSFEPLTRDVIQRSKAQGGNVMGLDDGKGNQIIMMIASRHGSAFDDPVMHAAVQEAEARIKHATHLAGTDSDFLYLNYAGEFQDPIAGYGEDSVAFLQATSERYDRGGVFQSRMPGGFKLRKATENSDKARTDSIYPPNDHQLVLGSMAQEL